MNEQFEMIAKTFQGLEEILAEEPDSTRSQRHSNRPPNGVIHRG